MSWGYNTNSTVYTVYKDSHFPDLPDWGVVKGEVQDQGKPGQQTHEDSSK